MPHEELLPDLDAVAKWDKMPQNKPSKVTLLLVAWGTQWVCGWGFYPY